MATAASSAPAAAASFRPIDSSSREVFFTRPSLVSHTTSTLLMFDISVWNDSDRFRFFASVAKDLCCGGCRVGAIDLPARALLRGKLERDDLHARAEDVLGRESELFDFLRVDRNL